MCDVVARALDKIKRTESEREEKERAPTAISCIISFKFHLGKKRR
jgi:hypothetical protein